MSVANDSIRADLEAIRRHLGRDPENLVAYRRDGWRIWRSGDDGFIVKSTCVLVARAVPGEPDLAVAEVWQDGRMIDSAVGPADTVVEAPPGWN